MSCWSKTPIQPWPKKVSAKGLFLGYIIGASVGNSSAEFPVYPKEEDVPYFTFAYNGKVTTYCYPPSETLAKALLKYLHSNLFTSYGGGGISARLWLEADESGKQRIEMA